MSSMVVNETPKNVNVSKQFLSVYDLRFVRLCLNSSGNKMLACNSNSGVNLFAFTNQTYMTQEKFSIVFNNNVSYVSFHPSNDDFAIADGSRVTIYDFNIVFSLPDDKEATPKKIWNIDTGRFSYNPSGELIVAAEKNCIRIWNPETNAVQQISENGNYSRMATFTWFTNERFLHTHWDGDSDSLMMFNKNTNSWTSTHLNADSLGYQLLSKHPFKPEVVYGGHNGSTNNWVIKTLNCDTQDVITLGIIPYIVETIAYFDDGQYVITCCYEHIHIFHNEPNQPPVKTITNTPFIAAFNSNRLLFTEYYKNRFCYRSMEPFIIESQYIFLKGIFEHESIEVTALQTSSGQAVLDIQFVDKEKNIHPLFLKVYVRKNGYDVPQVMSRTNAMMLDQGFTLQQLISKDVYEKIVEQKYPTLIVMCIDIVNDYTDNVLNAKKYTDNVRNVNDYKDNVLKLRF